MINFTITKEEFIRGLSVVQNVAAGRTTLPILSNVLLRAAGGKLHLTATDLDTAISCSVDAKVSKEGSTTVSAKRLFGVVREFRNESIEVASDDKHVLSLKCGPSHYKINGISADEFPPMPKTDAPEGDGITAPQAAFKTLLKRTAFAMSTDASRYVMCGTFLNVKENSVIAAATCGRRLAWAEMLESTGNSTVKEAIVPPNAVKELERMLGDKGDVKMVLSQNQVEFSLSGETSFGVTIKSKLVEGNYPNYRQVIPTDAKHKVTLNREEFASAVSRAKLMTTDNFASIKLVFKDNNLQVTVNAPGTGSATEDIAVNYKGEELAIAFNPDFLLQGLNAVSDEEVFVELIDGLSPGVVKINGPFLYVLSPIRLS